MSIASTLKRLREFNARMRGEGVPKKRRMTPRERLAFHLDALGFNCDPDEITFLQGYWTHSHQDCTDRWTARCRITGESKDCEITGMDTITLCARNGVTVDPNRDGHCYGDFVAYAKRKKS